MMNNQGIVGLVHVMLSAELEQLSLSELSSFEGCCLSFVERSESIRACLLKVLWPVLTDERFRDFYE